MVWKRILVLGCTVLVLIAAVPGAALARDLGEDVCDLKWWARQGD